MVSTFSDMAEKWMRDNIPSRAATDATEGMSNYDADAPLLQPDYDPAEGVRELFVQWLNSSCTLGSRWFVGLRYLHLDFCEWCIAHDDVPCQRDVFEIMLCEMGFLLGEADDGMCLISGLILRVDLKAHEQFQKGCK